MDGVGNKLSGKTGARRNAGAASERNAREEETERRDVSSTYLEVPVLCTSLCGRQGCEQAKQWKAKERSNNHKPWVSVYNVMGTRH